MSDIVTLNGYKIKDEKAVRSYETVASMKADTKLKEGYHVKTKGYYEANDGGNAEYLITNIESESEYQENLGNGLYATLIAKNNYNVLQFGVKNDGSTDSSAIVQNILENIMTRDEILLFPEGLYLFNSPIDMTNCIKRHIKGNFFYNYYSAITNGLQFNNCSGFINCRSNQFDNLLIRGNSDTYLNNGFQGLGMVINNCSISYFNNGINGSGTFTKNTINRCNTAITGCVDSKIINNTINANKHDGINLYQGCNDNIISENKVEWNERSGIGCYNTTHNVISNNIIDRNTNLGISLISCTGETITNNCLRRNGLLTTTKNRSHLYIEGCTKCIICNNSTQANNSQDDGSGTIVPQYSLEINTSNNMYLIGNDLSGGTQSDPIYLGSGNINVRILGANNEKIYKYAPQKTINANNGTNTFEIHCVKTGDYSQPNFHKIIATCRTGEDSGYGFLEFYAYNYKQYGSNVVRLSQTTINNDLTMSASYNSTDDKFYITITNSSTSQNYNVQLYEY